MCTSERVMFVLGSNIHRYGARVGVAPAKPIKLILEEQAIRKKSNKGAPSKESTGQTNDSEQGKDSMRELALQELLLNKEKFEYEKGIEVEEGDGSMPSSWREQQPEHSMSPAAGDDYQSSSSSDNAPLFLSNLRFLKNFPAAPSMAREGFWRGGRFQYRRNRGGEGVLAGEGHVLTAQKDDDANLQKIPLSGGFTAIEATTQYCQNIDWRLIGESSSKRISKR